MRAKIIVTVLVAIALASATIAWAMTRPRPASVVVDTGVSLADGQLLVRDTATGRLARVAADGTRAQSKLSCLRAYATHEVGACLRRSPGVFGAFELAVVDARLDVVRTVPLAGVPTRVRISTDGRFIGWTVFVSGHSYTDETYSTQSSLLDLKTDELTANLESFRVDGRKAARDANYWGISFAADDRTFYATLSTGGVYYLVKGDVPRRSITVIADGVECPSLSPDGTRVVYKLRQKDLTWRLWVM
ncbi:MAG: hypothetical protein QOE64_1149, partial [Frankiales bacterium]|nr:hypothetical protein [Frankiales bacterium]